MTRLRPTARGWLGGVGLTAALTAPLSAQRASELRLAASPPVRSAAAAADTTPRPPTRINAETGIAVGVLGGALGGVLGIGAGVAVAKNSNCTGDLCGLPEAALGLVVGESIGLAIGAHYGSNGRANLAAVTLASIGVGVAGTILGAYAGGWPILLVPVAQLATVLMLEHP